MTQISDTWICQINQIANLKDLLSDVSPNDIFTIQCFRNQRTRSDPTCTCILNHEGGSTVENSEGYRYSLSFVRGHALAPFADDQIEYRVFFLV